MGTVLLVEDDPEIRHPQAYDPAGGSAELLDNCAGGRARSGVEHSPARGRAASAVPEVAR
jgi:hypothetical protein